MMNWRPKGDICTWLLFVPLSVRHQKYLLSGIIFYLLEKTTIDRLFL